MMTILPLRKETRAGDLYKRPPEIESLLVELSSLPREKLIERAAISKKTDSGYVPSECLVYFIRASRNDDREAWFEQLYRILAARVLRALPKAESLDGKSTSLTREDIRDTAFWKFCELLSADRKSYVGKLDFFEIRFDGALANLRRDAKEKVWREAKKFKPLEYDDKSGELSPEVEAAAGSYDPFASSDFENEDYRSRLAVAIDTLPPEQSRVVHMLGRGFPIDSKEPSVMTIAKALRRSEKTIRTYRDKAFTALRAFLNEGEDQ
ncbi:DNA-binding response regulator [Desulfovibrio aminophilus]|uniref:DNA-binding response regulator n=1 Tax=Desulfovibrio aminophilus TaxID=81425 RepID=UPI00339296F3